MTSHPGPLPDHTYAALIRGPLDGLLLDITGWRPVFTASEPNTKYVDDITCLPLEGGRFLYSATVIDLASQRLAGWAIADHMRTDLVTAALAAAERTRGSLAGAILHTDHGAQYVSRAFADACRQAGVRQSMSATGSSADRSGSVTSAGTRIRREEGNR